MIFRKLVLILLYLALHACGGSNDNGQISENKAVAELPAGVQKLTLNGSGTLSAYIVIDGDTDNKILMVLDRSAGSASLVVPALTRELHRIDITYDYTLSGVTYILATASKSIDLSSGAAELSFSITDYLTDPHDDDNDGSSNIAELRSGTDPGDNTDTPHLAFTSGFVVNVGENTTHTGYQAAAIAGDGDVVSFSIFDGRDQDEFNIDAQTGILTFKDAPDYEQPGDIDQNNIYEVEIAVRDGTSLLSRSVLVTVTDVVENQNSKAFITVWKTDNPGFTLDNQIKIGTLGTGYNYSVDWGDGQTTDDVKGDFIHSYASPGIYTVRISGDFPQIFFESTTLASGIVIYDYEKILSIEQWGDIKWQSMNHAFFRCKNLVGNAVDEPDLSLVTDMTEMFRDASSFNQDISKWNVSKIVEMSNMFNGANVFNQDIGIWDVSSVTGMRRVFYRASAFNGDISGWDVSSVTTMSGMFREASAFNQNIANWNVLSVRIMGGMFRQASVFNQDIGEWKVSSVTDMNNMFNQASVFNQDIGKWSVSSVTDMNNMFNQARAFDQNLGGWDVSSVTNMLQMFSSLTLSTANYDALLEGWSGLNLQTQKPITIDVGKSQYSSTRRVARDTLINNFGWTISDGGVAP